MKVIVVLGIVLLATACQASIERDPVKVTYRNSGPVYDFSEDVEKVKVPSDETSDSPIALRPQLSSISSDRNEDGPDQAHIMIRRIFLVPLTPPGQSPAESMFGRGMSLVPSARDDSAESSFARNPPWPFMTPMRPPHHIFGADPASRSPMSPESSFEAPKYDEPPTAPREKGDSSAVDRSNNQMVDQLPLLVRMMLNSLRAAHDPSNSPRSEPEDFLTDLNKDASRKPPTSTNETGEEIVEIGGQKFLRKTQINRHVGDNMVFVTRRLIFVPLNETDSDPTTTTAATSTTATPIQDSTTASAATEAPTSSTTENKQPSEPTTTTTPASEATNAPESTTIAPIEASNEQPILDKERLVAKPEEPPKEETKPDDPNKPSIIIN